MKENILGFESDLRVSAKWAIAILLVLAEIVESVGTAVRPMVWNKDVNLQSLLLDHLPEVYCDRARIRQALLNIVSNVARFTSRGGIKVHVAERETSVVIGVTTGMAGR